MKKLEDLKCCDCDISIKEVDLLPATFDDGDEEMMCIECADNLSVAKLKVDLDIVAAQVKLLNSTKLVKREDVQTNYVKVLLKHKMIYHFDDDAYSVFESHELNNEIKDKLNDITYKLYDSNLFAIAIDFMDRVYE